MSDFAFIAETPRGIVAETKALGSMPQAALDIMQSLSGKFASPIATSRDIIQAGLEQVGKVLSPQPALQPISVANRSSQTLIRKPGFSPTM